MSRAWWIRLALRVVVIGTALTLWGAAIYAVWTYLWGAAIYAVWTYWNHRP